MHTARPRLVLLFELFTNVSWIAQRGSDRSPFSEMSNPRVSELLSDYRYVLTGFHSRCSTYGTPRYTTITLAHLPRLHSGASAVHSFLNGGLPRTTTWFDFLAHFSLPELQDTPLRALQGLQM